MKVYIEAGANNGIFQSRSLGHVNDEEYFRILIEAHYNIKGINTTRDEAIKTHVDYLAPMGYNYKIVSEAGQHDKIVFTKK
jgi:hypothetical protein